MTLDKAIIPAAGHGTRMLPVTRVVPKELLPVGSKPAIHWAIEEAAAAGLREIAIVVSPTKPLIATYIETSGLREELDLSFEFITQEEQLGLADAIWRCRDFAGDEPFGTFSVPCASTRRTVGSTATRD
jgi:UTP--glucose-1-phosphate uridylyltransferase